MHPQFAGILACAGCGIVGALNKVLASEPLEASGEPARESKYARDSPNDEYFRILKPRKLLCSVFSISR